MAGLRESWRLTAMQTIQMRALDLFDAHGFATVKIEDISEAAGVSASSIYRYFGTKEGLIVADDFDSWGQETLATVVDPHDPVGSVIEAVAAYETPGDSRDEARNPSASIAWRRVRYFFTEPSVRLAALASLDTATRRIAPLLTAHGALSSTQARVAAHALAFGYFACLEQWFLEDRSKPIASYVEAGLHPLRRPWQM